MTSRCRLACTFFLLLSAYPIAGSAWHQNDHIVITDAAMKAIDEELMLQAPVAITPYAGFLRKAGHAIGIPPTPEAFAQFLQVNDAVDIARWADNETDGMTWHPLQIMAIHSPDPDDGRDRSVVTKPAAKYLGGFERQAFRHMEKPPLNLSNWKNTVGYPFQELGEASLRVAIYFDIARLAWQVNEPYWAWRWLGCALHYIQDLAQPYHTTQDASHGRYLAIAFRIWLQQFGQVGFIKTAVQLISNSHLFYEDLVMSHVRLAREGRPADARAQAILSALVGTTAAPVGDVREYAKEVRDDSNTRAADLFATVHDLSGPRVLSLYDYPQPGDYPEPFLKEKRDLDFLAAERRFFELTEESWRLAGEATRRLVATFVAERTAVSPAALVDNLRKLLAE